jgi:hypothetical protein
MKPYMTKILGSNALGATTLAPLSATWAPSAAATFGNTIRQYFEIEIEIEFVYNMYSMRRFFTKKPYAPAAVSGPSQLCRTGNLQVRARP